MKKMNPFVAFVAGMMVAAILFAGIAGIVRGDEDDIVTLHVIEHVTNEIVTDTGEEGDSVGDLLTFANEIYDEANANMIGSDNGFCLRTDVGAAWECVWTTTLENGSLTVEGPFYDAGDSTLAITGGTGVYAHASGQMTLHVRNDEATELDFVYEIHMDDDND